MSELRNRSTAVLVSARFESIEMAVEGRKLVHLSLRRED